MAVLGAFAYRDQATYWGSPRQGGFGGQTFDAPKSIMVRWEDRVESFTDLSGNEHRSKAVVYAQEHLDLDGYLLKGSSSALDPTVVSGAIQIQRTDRIPDLRGLYEEFKVYL